MPSGSDTHEAIPCGPVLPSRPRNIGVGYEISTAVNGLRGEAEEELLDAGL
jgi:hypothetical protein